MLGDISLDKLARWRREGKYLHNYTRIGRSPMYYRDEVIEFIRNNHKL